MINSKEKGNCFERKIAKELSIWMFDDQNILKRHPSSGTDKCIWTGDIVPLAQLPTWKFEKWPFQIECKTGYDVYSPTFWKFDKIKEWFSKAKKESEINNQEIILLICQFKYKKKLVFTNKFLNNIDYGVIIKNEDYHIITYYYEDLISKNFNEVF